jgi:hypothetical protein
MSEEQDYRAMGDPSQSMDAMYAQTAGDPPPAEGDPPPGSDINPDPDPSAPDGDPPPNAPSPGGTTAGDPPPN